MDDRLAVLNMCDFCNHAWEFSDKGDCTRRNNVRYAEDCINVKRLRDKNAGEHVIACDGYDEL